MQLVQLILALSQVHNLLLNNVF